MGLLPARVRRLSKLILWGLVGLLGLAMLVVLPLTAVTLVVSALLEASLLEGAGLLAGLLVLTVGYWGLVRWSERHGLADWAQDTDREEWIDDDQ